ncbi:O-antigen ligase family protein [Patescibacteria group bacterium]
MKKVISNIMFGLVYVLCFFTPLVFSSLTKENYEFPKMFFVYFLGATIIFLFLLTFDTWRLKFKIPNRFVLLFLISIVVATLTSNHVYTSLWGYHSRQNGGLISYLVFFGIYFVALNTFSKQTKRRVVDVFLLALLPICLHGLLQIGSMPRVVSTFGQPNWLAAYIVILLPMLFLRIVDNEQKYLWLTILTLSTAVLVFTGSLSGVLGAVISLGYLGFQYRKNIPKYVYALLLLGFVLNFNFIKQRFHDALTFSIAPEDYQVSDSNLIRYGLWKGSLRLFVSSPKNILVGVGPENFTYEYPFFREDVLNYSSEWNYIMNKPHNYYLEVLVEQGIFGFVPYVLLLGWSLRSKDKFLTASFLGFYVTNIFSWPTVATSLVFWMFLVLREDTFQ